MLEGKLQIKDKTGPVESLKIAPFKKHIRKTAPHKHNNYFEIIYLTEGSGFHKIDDHEYAIKPPIVFIIRREQVHFWEIETVPSGYVLIIKRQFIDNCPDREIQHLFSKLSKYTCLNPVEDSTEKLFGLLAEEYAKNKVSNEPVCSGLLKALLGKLLQAGKSDISIVSISKNILFQRFRELLLKDFPPRNQVGHYAKLLNTTPQNLNAVCRKESGQSATEILSRYIIGEAKRLLSYTGSSIAEISDLLGFKDNSHFTKYFKRYTATTPNAFRASHK